MTQAPESIVEKFQPVQLEVDGVNLLFSLMYSSLDADVPVAVTIKRHPEQYPHSTRYLWRASGITNWHSADEALEYAKNEAPSLLSRHEV